MKNNLKKLSAFLLIFCTFFLWSCEKEENSSSVQEKEMKREVELSDIPNLMNSIQNKQQDGLLGKNAGDYLSLINTDKIIQITQNDGSKTYTFALNMHETDTLTNLVAKENGNGFDYYLVKYSSPQFELWKTAIANREYSDVSVTIENISLDGYSNSARGSCFDFAYSCPSGQHNSISELGFCIFPPYEWTATTYAVPCDEGGGGGGGGGHGGPNPPPAPDPYTEPIIPTLSPAIPVFIANLLPAQADWWNSANNDIKRDIVNYLNQNIRYDSIKIEAKLFINWAINYLINNPNVSWAQFKNWFMSPREGKDGYYDAAFWENPNLNFPQQNLPSMQNFLYAFPKIQNGNVMSNMPSTQVYQLVGGSILSNHASGNVNYQNACSLRGSRALNYAGVSIPVVHQNGVQKTEKGGDNENYILSAKAFNKYMNITFGPPTYRLTFADIGGNLDNIANFLQGKNGIYTIINRSPGIAGYSGHVDIIINGHCLGGANANPPGGVEYIEIWELN